MKPTQEQLNDPAWWNENVDPAHDYAFTTGPDWQGNNKYVGSVEFANKYGETGCEESLALGRDYWVPLAKRPTKAAFVPEVGVECEGFTTDLADIWKWRKVEPLKEISAGEFACLVAGRSLRFVDQFRPIKSERDLFFDSVKKKLPKADTDDLIFAGKLYDAGCRFVETDK